MKLFRVVPRPFALVSATTALPPPVAPAGGIRRSEDIVYSPPIKLPNQETVWKVGSKQLVTWDATGIPQEGKGNKGMILLGYDDNTGSENLDYSKLLFCKTPTAAALSHTSSMCGTFVIGFRTYMSFLITPTGEGFSADGWGTIHHRTKRA